MALSLRQAWRLRGIERRLRQPDPGLPRKFENFARTGSGGHPDGGRPGHRPGHSDRCWRAWLHLIAAGAGLAGPAALAAGCGRGPGGRSSQPR